MNIELGAGELRIDCGVLDVLFTLPDRLRSVILFSDVLLGPPRRLLPGLLIRAGGGIMGMLDFTLLAGAGVAG